jgi:hypothetical protein
VTTALVVWGRRASRTSARLWWLTFSIAATVFALTAQWRTGQSNDAEAAVWPAYTFAHSGTFYLTHVAGLPDNRWFVSVDGQLVSMRTMGVVLVSLPAQLLLRSLPVEPTAVGALTAVLLSAAAVGNMTVLLKRIVHTRTAVAAALTLAFGTALWTVGSAALWTHGPVAFFLSCALLAVAKDRPWLAAAAGAGAVLTRPHMGFAVVALAVGLALQHRNWRRLVPFAALLSAAVTALFVWNRTYLQRPGLLGPYAEQLSETRTGVGGHLQALVVNWAGGLLSPLEGVFLYTPVLLVLLPQLPAAWRSAPTWARSAAVGAVAYASVQYTLNRYTGGEGFFGNRLMISPLLLCTPLFALAFEALPSARRVRMAMSAAALSVAMHACGALLTYWWIGIGSASGWRSWYLGDVVRTAGAAGAFVVVVVATALAVALVRIWGGPLAAPRPDQPASDGFRLRMRASRPFTNAGLWSVDRLDANSTASLTATASGTSSRHSSSYVPSRRIARSTGGILSSVHSSE